MKPSFEPSSRASFRRAITQPVATLLALQLMGGMILAPHLTFFPLYVKGLGHSSWIIASIVAAKQAAGLIASLTGGALSDALGRKRTLLLGNMGYLLASFAFLSTSPLWIGVLWTVGGLGLGLHTLGGQSYLMDVAASAHLGVLSALFNWGYTVGGVLSSPMAGWLLKRGGYNALGAVLVIFAAATVVINQFILPPSPATRHDRRAKGLLGYGEIASRPIVWILAVLRFLPTFYYAMMLLLIPLLLDATGADETIIAWYSTVSWIVASLAQVVAGYAADRWGPERTAALAFAALLVSTAGIGGNPSRPWCVFSFGTVGLAAAWSLSTLLPTLVALVTAPYERGRVLGFIHLWWNLAMIVGSMVGGALFEISPALPFGVAGMAVVGAMGTLLHFHRRRLKGLAPESDGTLIG